MEQNIVLYRKYRPQKFSEVIGQEHVIKTLLNSVSKNTVGHAYLFHGPRGTGKTSIARLLSKAVNCESKIEAGEPCNKCQVCKDITEGRALDVLEIDAASNTGVDNMRDLIEGVRFNPNKLKYKVFIIDEVHMLSKGAFNALLKTLEEPPSHAIFMLATTEIEKVPDTIKSRVQRFDLKKMSISDIISKLKCIAEKEKLNVDEDAFRMIAQLSEGGMRDAESIFTRVVSFVDGDILPEHIESIAGVTNIHKISKFIDILSEKDVKRVIEYLNELEDQGTNMQDFLRSAMKYLRNILMFQISPKLKGVVAPELTEEQFEDMINQSKNFESDELKDLLESFISIEQTVKKTSIPLLPIELAVMSILK
jgi:DNA polymerase-3 subunit gamma/tau